jgi:hypothetical protein
LNRVFGDAANAPNPQRGLAQMMFGLSSLSGILLDEFAQVTGRSRREVLHGVDVRYLNAPRPGPNPAQPALRRAAASPQPIAARTGSGFVGRKLQELQGYLRSLIGDSRVRQLDQQIMAVSRNL